MKGLLKYVDEKWVVESSVSTLPLHPDVKLSEDLTQSIITNGTALVDFIVTTIAIGENEFDVIDCDVAVLKTNNNIDVDLIKVYGV